MHLREQYVTDRVVLTIQIQMLGSPDSFPLEQAWDDIEGPKDRWRTTAVSWCFTSYRVLPIISAENSSKRTTAWQMLIPFSKTDQNGDWSIFFCIYSQKKMAEFSRTFQTSPTTLRPFSQSPIGCCGTWPTTTTWSSRALTLALASGVGSTSVGSCGSYLGPTCIDGPFEAPITKNVLCPICMQTILFYSVIY